MMKPMTPTLVSSIPLGTEWRYEVKYDGFRALLSIDAGKRVKLVSRNGKSLLGQFPEINEFLQQHITKLEPYLPLVFDGELTILENACKADFSAIQTRGRMRSERNITEKTEIRPSRLLVFDVLALQGKDLTKEPYERRKKNLVSIFDETGFPLAPDERSPYLLQMIPCYDTFNDLWEKVILYNGEGIVAKRIDSIWEEGKKTDNWVKYKNWKYVSCFVTGYDKRNGYFTVAVYKDHNVCPVGRFLFGISAQEKEALIQIIRKNKRQEDEHSLSIDPAICVELKYLELYENQLREPHFSRFRFDLQAKDCTYEKMMINSRNFPADLEITHPDKLLWEDPPVNKSTYIEYLREISPFMLPFLKDRLLTVIRYPHGIFGEAFFQKNRPAYAPDYVPGVEEDGIRYIVCNDLKTLLWLGNQLAVEFHIPFQTVESGGPSEIVFDLDPPSKNEFHLAVKAAKLIKQVLDYFKLASFIKTSGNKGLQIYIPLPENRYSYDETRMFTEFTARYLVSSDPGSFTVERLKKKRGKRLYIDYVQHARGKTLIAPYSPRGNRQAAVAAPLFWDEVNDGLKMEDFRITTILKRIKEKGDPFRNYFEAKEQQNFDRVLQFLKK